MSALAEGRSEPVDTPQRSRTASPLNGVDLMEHSTAETRRKGSLAAAANRRARQQALEAEVLRQQAAAIVGVRETIAQRLEAQRMEVAVALVDRQLKRGGDLRILLAAIDQALGKPVETVKAEVGPSTRPEEMSTAQLLARLAELEREKPELAEKRRVALPAAESAQEAPAESAEG